MVFSHTVSTYSRPPILLLLLLLATPDATPPAMPMHNPPQRGRLQAPRMLMRQQLAKAHQHVLIAQTQTA